MKAIVYRSEVIIPVTHEAKDDHQCNTNTLNTHVKVNLKLNNINLVSVFGWKGEDQITRYPTLSERLLHI